MFTKEELRARKRKHATTVETVTLSTGEVIGMRHIDATERSTFQLAAFNNEGVFDRDRAVNAKPILLAMCICDPSGAYVFRTDDAARPYDVEAIVQAFEATEIDELFEHAQRINGLTAKAREEAAGNF